MRRIQFIELHEQAWFPSSLRDQVTDALQCGMGLLRAYAPIAPMLRDAANIAGAGRVVDLCSGAGGPWPHLAPLLPGPGGRMEIRLTDKYPHRSAFEPVNEGTDRWISFCEESVDARKVPRALSGVRTLFSSFHHFPPEDAAAVLQDAVDARQAIGVFEITRRAPSAVLRMIPWALLAFFYTPRIRPFRWSRLLWTYLIPVIPAVLFFDGVVSCLRTYRPGEMEAITRRLERADYDWRTGEYATGEASRMPITFLIGTPRARR